MKIQFDRDLQFQQDAIASIVNIFDGQEVFESTFTVHSPEYLDQQSMINDDQLGYTNHLKLSDEKLLQNVHQIQLGNALNLSDPEKIKPDHLDFSIEM